jgi:hypothetical protein
MLPSAAPVDWTNLPAFALRACPVLVGVWNEGGLAREPTVEGNRRRRRCEVAGDFDPGFRALRSSWFVEVHLLAGSGVVKGASPIRHPSVTSTAVDQNRVFFVPLNG